MITRTFEKCGIKRRVSYPEIREWKVKTVELDRGGILSAEDFASSRDAAIYGRKMCAEWLAGGWSEVVQRSAPNKPMPEPMTKQEVAETAQIIALRLAETPDWHAVRDVIGEYTSNHRTKRQIMKAVMEHHAKRFVAKPATIPRQATPVHREPIDNIDLPTLPSCRHITFGEDDD